MSKEVVMTNLEKRWLEEAKLRNKTIVLPEAGFSERITLAGIECAEKKIAKIILLVSEDNQLEKYNVVEGEYLKVVNFKTHETREMLAEALYNLRKEKGLTKEGAYDLIDNPVYFGTMMVELGLADGLVAGAEISTADTFKPAFQIIKARSKEEKISSFMVMVKPEDNGEEKVYVLSDCGVNINPSMEEIVGIAKQSARSCKEIAFMEPKVALLSYSTKGSAEGDSAIKMRTAAQVLKEQNVDFIFDGEMQLDAAIVPEVNRLKAPNSDIKGDANVFVFPDLSAGNIGYKLMQRFGGYKAFGPIAQGVRKPINDISRGANVNEIVFAIAITTLQD